MYTMITTLPSKVEKENVKNYICELCSFNTYVLRDFKRHLDTKKHNDNVKMSMITKKPPKYSCECGREYRYASGLSRHRRTCSSTTTLTLIDNSANVVLTHVNTGAGAASSEDDSDIDADDSSVSSDGSTIICINISEDTPSYKVVHRSKISKDDDDDDDEETSIHPLFSLTRNSSSKKQIAKALKDADKATTSFDKATYLEILVERLLEETKELRQMVAKQTEMSLERDAKIMELASRPTTNIINNHIGNNVNNHFSVVNYLNTDCKDAMSLSEFIDSMQITMDDMYYTRDNGYVKGMCNIFTRSIENLKPTERPIHCTDKRRLRFFIKENEIWVRDDNHQKINSVMYNITEKQIQLLQQWKEFNPNWLSEPSLQDEFILITSRILGMNSEKGEKAIKSIIKTIGNITDVKTDVKM